MSKVLIIGDDQDLFGEISDTLRQEGNEVLTASNEQEGLALARRQRPNLIICETSGQGLDGFGILMELRSHLATCDIPFILMSSDGTQPKPGQSTRLGIEHYLTMPVNAVELMQIVHTIIEKRVEREREFEQKMDTLHRALVEQHEQSLLKSQLVATLSHEFRNPLAIIMFSNSVLSDYADRLTEESKAKYRAQIERASRFLVQMLDDLLVVAQMEVGHAKFEPEPLNLEQFCHDIIQELQEIYGSECRLLINTNGNSTASIDKKLLRQIITNLLTNAIKYSPGESEVVVTCVQDHDKVTLTITDGGIGIPEADQAHIFETFHRAANVAKIEGTGLGLGIVKNAVDLHGGTINFESMIGIGTKFTVVLPQIS